MSNFHRSAVGYFICVVCLLVSLRASAQEADSTGQQVVIQNIFISGNKKTKSRIIQREIPFRAGDTLTLAKAKELISAAQKNVYNTELFISVDIYDREVAPGLLDIYVIVKERWYTLPIPYVELADRSFNVWLQKYKADLKRLSYGMNFLQQNLTGHNDDLNVLATAGFNRQLEVDYTTPYLTEGMRSRLKFGFGILSSKELPYMSTDSNKLVYHQSDQSIRKTWNAAAAFIIRREIRKREWLRFSLNGIHLFDSIHVLNPDYFSDRFNRIVFPEVEYKMKYDDVDNIMYPLRGNKYEIILSKRGLGWSGGLNRLMASAFGKWYRPLGRDWFSRMEFRGQVMLPFNQPYYNTRTMGYGDDYVRGFEFFVVDGVASFVARADLKKRLAFFELPTLLKSRDYRRIPFTIYAKMYGDAGSAYNRRQTLLGNRMLFGGGVGLDIVTVHDIAVSVNFSLNSLGQSGIFFHQE